MNEHKKLCQYLLLAITYLSAPATASNGLDKAKHLQDFIKNLDRSCAYTDGYQCHLSDPNFYSQEAQKSLVPAVYLPAWTIAYTAFLQLPNLSAEQKELTHYKIGFAEQDDQIVILFAPLFLPYFDAKEPKGISRGTYGQSLKFWVDKKSLIVTKHIFLK